MAYTTTYGQNGQSRAGSLALVALIHAGIGAVLITGMTVDFINSPPAPPLESEFIEKPDTVVKLPPLPEVPVPEKPNTAQSPLPYVPETRLNTGLGPVIDPGPPLTLDGPLFTGPINPEPVIIPNITPTPPAPRFTPQAASPRGDRSRWITTGDYRPSWIRQEMEGSVSYALTIGKNGRVENCEITATSGHSQLDKATCDQLKRRAAFEPATDGQGQKVQDVYTGSVIWRIPE